MIDTNMTLEQIEKRIAGVTEYSRAFKFDFDAKELAANIQTLMQNGLAFEDAEKVVWIKVVARFAARFQGRHADVMATEDYTDQQAKGYVEELNMYMCGLEAALSQAADNFCWEVFGDAGESIYEDDEMEVMSAGGVN
jgi:hypothetical protein